MPVRRVPALLAGALAVTVALTGCTEQSAAPAPLEPSPTSASAASASETPTGPPEMPDEARGTGRKAAVAFVRHWVDTLNYSADTLDSAPLKALSSPDCSACTAAWKAITRVERRGGNIIGHEWTIASARVANATSRLVQVEALVRFAPSRVKQSSRSKPVRYDGGSTLYVFDVERTGDAIQISRFFGAN